MDPLLEPTHAQSIANMLQAQLLPVALAWRPLSTVRASFAAGPLLSVLAAVVTYQHCCASMNKHICL